MRLLFTAGTARGGTNLRALMLNQHPDLVVSLDPFIPLFRFYRNSLLKATGTEHLLEGLHQHVLDDYYFSTQKLALMKAIQSADPDIPFDDSGWEELKQQIASRMSLASADLVPHLDMLPAPTFREVFLNTKALIATRKPGANLLWSGFNDNWTMEFFPLIAKLIPEARFMLHLRDPRAVVNSSEFAEPDPACRPTVVSFARHLRKYIAFAQVLPELPELKDRLLITQYEPFLTDTEASIRQMTDFLEVEYLPVMRDIDSFKRADGTKWGSDWPIYQASGDIWRQEMPRPMAELTEFICYPEMRLQGYEPELYDSARGLSGAAFDFARTNIHECIGWNTDFADIEHTLGCELFRQRLIASDQTPPTDVVERCFLFEQVYTRIKQL